MSNVLFESENFELGLEVRKEPATRIVTCSQMIKFWRKHKFNHTLNCDNVGQRAIQILIMIEWWLLILIWYPNLSIGCESWDQMTLSRSSWNLPWITCSESALVYIWSISFVLELEENHANDWVNELGCRLLVIDVFTVGYLLKRVKCFNLTS